MAEKTLATRSGSPTAKGYSEKQVKALSGLSAIRSKFEMYVGDADLAPWTILREAADNTVDEALAGRNNLCYIHIDQRLGHWVADNGQGIPVGDIKVEDPVTHKIHKVTALKAVVSLTHAGAKFDNKAYATSRGTHGVGIKATNALSSRFQVWTCYQGQWYTTAYEKGKEVEAIKKCKAPKLPNGKHPKRGTVIHFKQDPTLLGNNGFPASVVFEWSKLTAYMLPKFRVLVEARTPKGDVKSREFYYENGPKDYIEDQIKSLGATPLGKPFFHTSPLVDLALVFTNYTDNATSFYTNGLKNSGGGSHSESMFKALAHAIKPYAKGRGKKKAEFTVHDLKEGIVGVLNCKLSSPKFGGQTKEKLVDERAKVPLYEELLVAFKTFFDKNKKLAATLCEQAMKLKGLKEQFAKNKAAMRELNRAKTMGLSAKFASAPRAKPHERETYLVEGDSAGGTAKQARDKGFQEVLPLKGKIINTMRATPEKALASEEVIGILAAIGYDPKARDPMQNLRTGAIMMLADPDPDGKHINSLNCTLIYKYLPELFERGMVYVVDAPEYYARVKGAVITGDTLEEVRAQVPKGTDIQHIKGWGQINADVLEPLAFNPATRRLVQLQAIKQGDQVEFVKLMGEDPEYRRELLGV
jgi:DNA gyrase subunit B